MLGDKPETNDLFEPPVDQEKLRRKNKIRELTSILSSSDAGYLDDEKIKGFFEQSGGDADKFIHTAAAYSDALTRGVQDEQQKEAALAELGLGPLPNYFRVAGQGFVGGIADAVKGTIELVAPPSMDLGVPNQAAPRLSPVAKARKFVDTKLLGLPEDPIERAGYESQYPKTALGLGDFAAFVATTAIIPERATVGLIPKALRVGSVTKWTGAGAAIGGVIGAATAPEDADWLTLLDHASIGVGAGALVASAFLGRAIGSTSRAARVAELFSAVEDSALGGLMKTAPRLAFGKMAQAGIIGGAYTTTTEIGKGVPIDQAIGNGIMEGFKWMSYDVALAGIGKAARWMPIHARISEGVAKKLVELKIPSKLASVLGDMAQLGSNAATGATLGGVGGGPIVAAIGGAITAAKGAGLQLALADTTARLVNAGTDPALVEKLVKGQWTKMSVEEAATVTKAILADTASVVAGQDDVARLLIREALGADATNHPEARKLRAELGQITTDIFRLKSAGIAETDPKIIQLAKAAFERQESLAKIFDDMRAQFRMRPSPAFGGKLADFELEGIIKDADNKVAQEGIDEVLTPSKLTRLGEGVIAYTPTPSGVARVAERLGAARAPAGARGVKEALAASIPQQAADSIPLAFKDARTYFAKQGKVLSVSTDMAGGVKYTVKEQDKLLAVGKTMQEVVNKLSGERGAASPALLGHVARAGLGALAGPFITDAVGLTDENDSTLKKMGYGAIAGLSLGLLGMKKAGIKLTEEGERAIKFTKQSAVEQLSEEEARKFVGRPDGRFQTKIGGSAVSGRRLYWALPHAQQLDHTIATMDKAASLTRVKDKAGRWKVLDKAERMKKFEGDLIRFSPFYQSPEEYARLEASFDAAAKAIGYTDQEAYRLKVGWNGWMTTDLAQRGRLQGGDFSLRALASDPDNPLSSVKGIQDLKDRVLSGEIIAGEPIPLPGGYKRAARAVVDQANPPANTLVSKMVDFLASIKPLEVTGTGEKIMPWGGVNLGMRPNMSFYRYAERLQKQGDPIGQAIYNITDNIFKTDAAIKNADAIAYKRLGDIFSGITNKEEHDLVRAAIEKPEVMAALAGKNDRVYEAAIALKTYLNEWADKLQLPRDMRIEDYFPWVYNHNSLAQLKEMSAKGIVPKIVQPMDWSGSSHVFFNHFEARTGAFPMALRESPLTSMRMYVHGANRKLYMDQLLANVTTEKMAEIARAQPYLAKDLGAWILDQVGVPGPGALASQRILESVGLKLSKFSMFNSTDFGQKLLDEFFINKNSATNLAKLVTSYSYLSKIGWNFLSAAVNASQFITGGGTDIGLLTLFQAMPAGLAVTLSEASKESSLPFLPMLSPVIDAAVPRVKQYRRMLADTGIFGQFDQTMFDEIARHEAVYGSTRAFSAFTGALTGGVTGAFGTALYNQANDSEGGVAGGAAVGALVGGIGAYRSGVARKILMRVRDTATFTFNLAETFNRATIGVAGFKEARAAEKAAASPAYAAYRNAREIVDHTIVGAIGGGATAYNLGDEQNRTGNIVAGAALGATLLGGAFAVKGERTYARVQAAREAIAKEGREVVFGSRIIEGQMKLGMHEYTPNEINELYAALSVHITQFRMGKVGRGPTMNTPLGQALGALQSYTINQADFIGGRMQSFWDSYGRAMKGENVPVDFRIFRYSAFVMGVGAVYSMLFSSLDNNHDPEYWLSRMGFGIMPTLRYNETAKHWEFKPIEELFSGPLVNDITYTANAFLKLMTDKNAQMTFADMAEDVANHVFVGARTLKVQQDKENGKMLKMLSKEGLLDTGK